MPASLSIVIPIYNSAAIMRALLERLVPELESLGVPFEVVLVNDGSRDASWERIGEVAREYPCVRGVNLMRNYGQHNALLCGIRAARNEIVITMDDDLQHPPEEIPKLLSKLDEGFDVVYGRPAREQHGLWRDVSSRITKMALKSSMGVDAAGDVSAFRAFRTELRRAFANYQSSYVSIDVLLTWGTTRFTSIPVRHDPREIGVSNYTFRKLVVHAINMLTGFSTWPLQVASLIGFGFTLFGLLVLAFTIVRYIVEGGSIPGFAFLASIISIFSGAQLFALGIIGEYLARMHFRMMERLPYTVREVTEGVAAPDDARLGEERLEFADKDRSSYRLESEGLRPGAGGGGRSTR